VVHKDPAKVKVLRQVAEQRDARAAADIKEFNALLRRPCAIMMLVPAGAPVDSVIRELSPQLEMGDLIIETGNSYFKVTDVRARNLAVRGIQFLGAGVVRHHTAAAHAHGQIWRPPSCHGASAPPTGRVHLR